MQACSAHEGDEAVATVLHTLGARAHKLDGGSCEARERAGKAAGHQRTVSAHSKTRAASNGTMCNSEDKKKHWERADVLPLLFTDQLVVDAHVDHRAWNRQGERWTQASALLDINLRVPMAMLNYLAPRMRRRGAGQLVLMSSLAAYHGLPVTPSYSASKAGIKAYGEALRGWLAADGVGVTVVMPGYVSSRMCHAMPGPKPFLWQPERAARLIRRGIARNRARISFPFPLNFGSWWLAVLPAALSQRCLTWLNYGATSDGGSRKQDRTP